MRTLLALLVMLCLLPDASAACSCFPPEVQARTAQEALESARLAVYGRVVEVDAGGTAKILVLESFKGPPVGSSFEAGPRIGQCEASAFSVDEEALVLSFNETATACDKHPPEHFLLNAFRSNAAKAR